MIWRPGDTSLWRNEPGARDITESPRVILDIRRSNGSVEHYYHFLFGFLAPILLQPPAELAEQQLIRSCGPMDQHIAALGLPQLHIVAKAELEGLRGSGHPVRFLQGMDHPDQFDREALARFRAVVLDRLSVTPDPVPQTLLMIGRGRSPDFYQSAEAEVKSSASLRRSIPNLAEIQAAIEQDGEQVAYRELETATFASQVALFAGARTVIAQHGASLANILWMQPGGTIIEINPKLGGAGEFVSAFEKLARCCGHAHVAVPQTTPHSRVMPKAVLEALNASK